MSVAGVVPLMNRPGRNGALMLTDTTRTHCPDSRAEFGQGSGSQLIEHQVWPPWFRQRKAFVREFYFVGLAKTLRRIRRDGRCGRQGYSPSSGCATAEAPAWRRPLGGGNSGIPRASPPPAIRCRRTASIEFQRPRLALDDEAVAGAVELAPGCGCQQTAADQGLPKATGSRRQHRIPPIVSGRQKYGRMIVSLWVGSARKRRKIRHNRQTLPAMARNVLNCAIIKLGRGNCFQRFYYDCYY